MPKLKCPKCHKGNLARSTIKEFGAKLGGIPFTIDNAEVWRCAECGHVVATANDLKRWRDSQRAYLQARGFVLAPEAVRELRESLGLSVADLAALLAVTRQTIHAWERPGLGALQVGPSAIILRLLAKELSMGSGNSLLASLAEEAKARGQSIAKLINVTSDRSSSSLQISSGLVSNSQECLTQNLIRRRGSIWAIRETKGKAA
jgi:YgiT-type zinc finger domain-containing protein